MVLGVATIMEYHSLMPDSRGEFIAAQILVRHAACLALPVCVGPASHALCHVPHLQTWLTAIGLYRYGMGNATEAKSKAKPCAA
jgi:hypothetical protein